MSSQHIKGKWEDPRHLNLVPTPLFKMEWEGSDRDGGGFQRNGELEIRKQGSGDRDRESRRGPRSSLFSNRSGERKRGRGDYLRRRGTGGRVRGGEGVNRL